MYSDLNVFALSGAMATHAGTRQAVIARNLANADTPGYRARDIVAFSDAVSDPDLGGGLRATRSGHLSDGADRTGHWAVSEIEVAADPNGNTVSVEREMLNAVEVRRQHDRALAIYKSALGILRAGLGKV